MRRKAPHLQVLLKALVTELQTLDKGGQQTKAKLVPYPSLSRGAEEWVAEVMCRTPEHRRSRAVPASLLPMHTVCHVS